MVRNGQGDYGFFEPLNVVFRLAGAAASIMGGIVVTGTEKPAAARDKKSQPEPFRVLSMDGGGIYGLFTVLMLKELCKRNPNFLKGDDVDLFAGTSAGALIALALAGAQNPRDIILSGRMEAFFSDKRLYSCATGPGMLTGALGLTSWTGRKNTEALFKEYYGDCEMCIRDRYTTISRRPRKTGIWRSPVSPLAPPRR